MIESFGLPSLSESFAVTLILAVPLSSAIVILSSTRTGAKLIVTAGSFGSRSTLSKTPSPSVSVASVPVPGVESALLKIPSPSISALVSAGAVVATIVPFCNPSTLVPGAVTAVSPARIRYTSATVWFVALFGMGKVSGSC